MSNDWDIISSIEELNECNKEFFPVGEYGEVATNLASMSSLMPLFIPLLDKVEINRICEIGSDKTSNSKILADYCKARNAELDIIDPVIKTKDLGFDTSNVNLFSEMSIDYFKKDRVCEAYFIDGDHNFYTVIKELEAIAEITKETPSLLLLHDVGWPCARRDMYYNPSSIPAEYMQEYGENIILNPTSETDCDDGISFMAVARKEGGEKNGVLTAVEDFLSRNEDWELHKFPSIYGFGIMWNKKNFSAEVQQFFNERIAELEKIKPLLATLELNRIMLLWKTHQNGKTWKKQKDRIELLESKVQDLQEKIKSKSKTSIKNKFNKQPNPKNAKSLRNVYGKHFPKYNYLSNISDRKGFLYMEVPKVACSTVKRTLQLVEVEKRSELLDDSVHNKEESPLLSFSNSRTKLDKILSGEEYFRFAFVRNPFTRILSAYLDKAVKNDWEKNRLMPDLGLNPEKEIKFIDFLKAVKDVEDYKRDIHWTSQSYILRQDIIKYNIIGKFEKFEEDFTKALKRICGKNYKEYYTEHRPHSTGASDQLSEYLGKEEEQIILDIYQQDFKEFGYSRKAGA